MHKNDKTNIKKTRRHLKTPRWNWHSFVTAFISLYYAVTGFPNLLSLFNQSITNYLRAAGVLIQTLIPLMLQYY